MIIRKKWVRSLEANLPTIPEGTALVFSLGNLAAHHDKVIRSGFKSPFTSGMSVLPAPIASTSRFNAEGKYLIHRDQAKETVYRQLEWTHKEWHGHDIVDVTDVYHYKYERYPRTFLPPPSITFEIVTATTGDLLIATDQITYKAENHARCLHTINLILEHFGECHVLDQNLEAIIRVAVQRLNWEILPDGEKPWDVMKGLLNDKINGIPAKKKNILISNLNFINKFGPTFAAVGRAGFTGYVVFGFPAKNLYVCESIHSDNATYVFAENWEVLSKLTKAEILGNDLQQDRIIHMPGWDSKIEKLLS